MLDTMVAERPISRAGSSELTLLKDVWSMKFDKFFQFSR